MSRFPLRTGRTGFDDLTEQELVRSRITQVSKPECMEAFKEQLFSGIMGDDVCVHVRCVDKGYQTQKQHASASSSFNMESIPQAVLDKIVEIKRTSVRGATSRVGATISNSINVDGGG